MLVMGMAFLAALLGLAVGSYLNVVIWRLRTGEQGFRSRSKCPDCHKVLKPSELVPLVSFLALKGRCSGCGAAISWQYPLVEVSTMLLFLLAWHVHGGAGGVLGPEWLGFLRDILFVAALTVVFVIDARDMLVHDSVVLPAAAAAFLLNILLGHAWTGLLLAAAVGAGFFLFQYAVSRGRWIGGGDIRIGLMMGAMLGFPGVLAALLLSYVLGAVAAVFLILFGKKGWKSQLAFGTFLSVGTAVILFFGEAVWNWYGNLL